MLLEDVIHRDDRRPTHAEIIVRHLLTYPGSTVQDLAGAVSAGMEDGGASTIHDVVHNRLADIRRRLKPGWRMVKRSGGWALEHDHGGSGRPERPGAA